MLVQNDAAWEKSYMNETDDSKGRGLYERLMALKPDGLSPTRWAEEAGLNRGFFTNLKTKGGSSRTDSIKKLLDYIGRTEADLAIISDDATRKSNATVVKFEGASLERMPRDLPIYGTGLGGDLDIDGEAIEQTSLNSGSTIDYVRRPVILDGNAEAYGLYVQGSSMDPVYPEGTLVLVETKRPPRVGDDVVVYLRMNGEADFEDDGMAARRVLIKRLVRRSGSYVELRQFNPDITFKVSSADVVRTHRVLTLADLLG